MNKLLSVVLFLFGFIESYLIMSFYIPSFKIALIAEPFEVILKSIRGMWLFKSIISLVIGIILAIIPLVLKRKNNWLRK